LHLLFKREQIVEIESALSTYIFFRVEESSANCKEHHETFKDLYRMEMNEGRDLQGLDEGH
jgi:hypothetical protein